jgi:hypothetical protein
VLKRIRLYIAGFRGFERDARVFLVTTLLSERRDQPLLDQLQPVPRRARAVTARRSA